jgi:hypothetical protein
MAVEAVIFDVSETLVKSVTDQAVPGMPACCERLKRLDLRLIAVGQHSTASLERRLRRAGLVDYFDDVLGEDRVGAKKGSAVWIEHIRSHTGLECNQLFYVGDSRLDMVTALRGPVLYAHADWAPEPWPGYGLRAPAPGWVGAVVEHILRKKESWFWTLSTRDPLGRPVRVTSLCSVAGRDYYAEPQRSLWALLKRNTDYPVGRMPMRDFVTLHLLASLSLDGTIARAQRWTLTPSSSGTRTSALNSALDTAAKMFGERYDESTITRWRPADNSNHAFKTRGPLGAIDNQARSLKIPERFRGDLQNETVLLIDDFLTRGYSVEVARNLLMAARAAEVIVATAGKYPTPHSVLSVRPDWWDPYGETPPSSALFDRRENWGVESPAAHQEFVESFNRMRAETW